MAQDAKVCKLFILGVTLRSLQTFFESQSPKVRYFKKKTSQVGVF